MWRNSPHGGANVEKYATLICHKSSNFAAKNEVMKHQQKTPLDELVCKHVKQLLNERCISVRQLAIGVGCRLRWRVFRIRFIPPCPTSWGKTYACKAPECVYRKPTHKEMKQRNRFALVCRVVSVLLADPALRKAYEKEFKKKHAGMRTLRQYVFKQVWYGLPK